MGLAVAGVMTLSACQPRFDAQFHIINDTHETVTVSWKGNEHSLATISPGQGTPFGFGDRCDGENGDILVAVSESGKTYTYGPGICNGKSWRIKE
ncbi:hypothetical protein [Acrocarpospora sp. B8E8]|uniref:hypothetical protein n=1 Tax=Acrocarpospora sp. B8E8 TaxID=3153572 RepID=UPI00325D1FFA